MTPIEVGFLCGTLWAMVLVVWAIADQVGEEPHPWLVLIGTIYDGFDSSWQGILHGAGWAFADGFISGFVLAHLAAWIW